MVQEFTSGLLAFGKSGEWNVDIGELSKGSNVLFVITIEHPVTTIQFSIKDLSFVDELAHFLTQADKLRTELELTKSVVGNLCLIFDEGRLYLVNRQTDDWGVTSLIRVRLDPEAQTGLTAALEDAIQDLKDV